MADIMIEYRDRPAALAEVVTDIDEQYSAMVSAVRDVQEVPAPCLGRLWWVTVSPSARLRTLVTTLPELLRVAEDAKAYFEIVVPQQNLERHSADAVRRLANLGVVQLASRPLGTGEPGKVLIHGEGTGGPAQLDWPSFDRWLAAFLFDKKRADVRKKLDASGSMERHVFIGASFSTPWAAYHALSDEYRDLPPSDPKLPTEVTHLWAWSYPIGRCIAWFPDTGWFDPSSRWATP